MEKFELRNNTYNLLNFLIFVAIYFYVLIYQYSINTPSVYYIALVLDIIFCIYLVNFTNFYLYAYDTLLSGLSLITIFAFVVLRLISTIVYPYYFLKVEDKRKDNNCTVEEIPKELRYLMYMNKVSYLYSTISILLLLFMILFWGKKMNDNINYQEGLGMDKKAYIGFLSIIMIITFSIMNTYYTLKFTAVSKRTVICLPKDKNNEDNNNI